MSAVSEVAGFRYPHWNGEPVMHLPSIRNEAMERLNAALGGIIKGETQGAFHELSEGRYEGNVHPVAAAKHDLRMFLESVLLASPGLPSRNVGDVVTMGGQTWMIYGGLTHGDPVENVLEAACIDELGIFNEPLEPAPALVLHTKEKPEWIQKVCPWAYVVERPGCGHVWGETHDCDVPHTVINHPSVWDFGALDTMRIGYVVDYAEEESSLCYVSAHWKEGRCS